MSEKPTVEQIRSFARNYASICCSGTPWAKLPDSCKGDFWTSAQMDLNVPISEWVAIPDEELNRP